MRAARKLGLIATVAVLAATLAGPATAHAVSSKKSIWGPARLAGQPQFPLYRDLGAGIYQIAVRWDRVASKRPGNASNPSDPAYAWPAELDDAVQQAGQYGIRVSVMLIGTPSWANGGKPYNWVPNDVADFANFARAAALRYPQVHLWMVWGEPTRQANFMPLGPQRFGKALTKSQARAPKYYARLLDAAYGALKGVSKSNLVIGGNTFTAGRISPLNWIRYMRLPNGRPPRMDLYGHNPFSLRRPDLRKGQVKGADPGFADFSDLDTLTGWLDRNMRAASGAKLRLFLSEFTIPTDQRNWAYPFYTSRAVQSDWLAAALKITRSWSRIYTLGWYTLYDEDVRLGRDEVHWGLLDLSARPKPAYYTYKRG